MSPADLPTDEDAGAQAPADQGGAHEHDDEVHARQEQKHHAYWRVNLTVVGSLLVVWALVSYGAGILFAPWLNQFMLPGTQFPLGFWFAQQGAIYVFVLLIFTYVVIMNRIERASGLSD